MKLFYRSACLVVCAVLFGCTSPKHDKAGHAKSVSFGVSTDPVIKEFVNLFAGQQGLRHWISYYDGYGDAPEWRSYCVLHDRYKLTLAFEIEINRQSKSFKRTTPFQLYVTEVVSVEVPRNTELGVSCKFGDQWTIGESEWAKLVECDGDFSGIGIALKQGSPVLGIDRLKQ